MPSAERIATRESIKQEISQSPRTKRRRKHSKQKGSRPTTKTLGQPKLCVLSKPEDDVMNGKHRHRFPDPSHDKCVLLGIFDKEQTLLKLHYIDSSGIITDEVLEKEIMKNPYGIHYFLKLEQIQRDSPNGEPEIETRLQSRNIICAKLNDHTVSDTSVPTEVAGFWFRMFGPKSVFTLNFTLWSAEVNGSNNSSLQFKSNSINESFYNLEKRDELHVQFGNKPRRMPTKKKKKSKKPPPNQNLFERQEIINIVKKARHLRDNGRVEEFEAKYSEILKPIKKNKKTDEELALILEESMSLCYQGNPSEGKKLLQKAVQMSSKSSNTNTIKSRAYLYLALIHINDGSFGTAQECLGMVGKDLDHALSTEDIALRSKLHGIVMMNFGQKLKVMSQNLWQEATENFEHALELCVTSESDMINDDSISSIHLWLAKLHLSMLKSVCSPGGRLPDLKNGVIEHLTFFDDIESVKLSRRTTISGLLVKAEYCLFLQQQEEATDILENVQELIAIDNIFYCLEKRALEKLKEDDKSVSRKDYDVEMVMLAKTREILAKSDSDTGYSGDESSSNEKIDLEAVRYKQTTYV